MKASVIHQYGGPEVLKYEDYPDPTVGAGQVLVRVAATSINPIDIGRRSGMMKEVFPIKFPGILGRFSNSVPGLKAFPSETKYLQSQTRLMRNSARSQQQISQKCQMVLMWLNRLHCRWS
jgi:hypothetical protein